ncbi:MAG TPA: DUF5719 family protein [Acidimicrobiales bacterium]|nr:DUF5719 family protein [Acidimicrobiales bacterium]
MRRRAGIRLPAVVVLAGIMAGMALVDITDRTPVTFGSSGAFAMPTADGPSSLTSTWFCAASANVAEGQSGLDVLVANFGDEARSGTVTWMADGADPVIRPLQVGAHDGVSLAADDAVDAGAVSAVVELDGGSVAVEHAVSVGAGSAVAPCAPSASGAWYLANGTTARDASEVLVLFNPFPGDAVVDISFSTDQGRDEPEALQGLPVPARSTTRVAAGEYVRRRDVAAATVSTRTGRVVVDRLQRFDGSEGRRGIALALAAPAPSPVWTFPAGRHQEGLAERWHVYNPGERDAVVIVEVAPEEGEIPIPVERTVSAGAQLVIDAAEASVVPAGVGHSSVVRSINGVPVVAERELSGVAPSPRRGWSSMPGSPLEAERWLLAAGDLGNVGGDRVSVFNPGPGAVRLSVRAQAGAREVTVAGLEAVELAPGSHRQFDVGDLADGPPRPLVVEADGPVVVERDLSPAADPGISTLLGIPLP